MDSNFVNHPAGTHVIISTPEKAQIGMTMRDFHGTEVRTLTRARKLLGLGQAIVRKSDSRLISIKR